MDIHLKAKRNLTLFGIFISVALALLTIVFLLLSLGVLVHGEAFYYFFGSMAIGEICISELHA